MRDFFISYNKADQRWAEWIAWQLEGAGYSTVLQTWDFRPGSNFALEMHEAAQSANRTIAVLSPDFLRSQYTQAEWAAAFARDPSARQGVLLPVRVRDCAPGGLLSTIVYIDLVGLTEDAAKTRLLGGISIARSKPVLPPTFPTDVIQPTSPALPAKDSRLALLHISGTLFVANQPDAIKRQALDSIPSLIRLRLRGSVPLAGFLHTGDITYTGAQADYSYSSSELTKLCTNLAIAPSSDCYVVPGNHDVTWSMIGPADDVVLDGLNSQEQIAKVLGHSPTMYMLSARLRNFYSFTSELLGKARAWRFDKPWRVDTKDMGGASFAFIQLNSAWALGPDSPNPILGEFQVREAMSEAGDVDYRIWIAHHPLQTLRGDEQQRIRYLLNLSKAIDLIFSDGAHSRDGAPHFFQEGTVTEIQLGSFGFESNDPICNLVEIDPANQDTQLTSYIFDRRTLHWIEISAPHVSQQRQFRGMVKAMPSSAEAQYDGQTRAFSKATLPRRKETKTKNPPRQLSFSKQPTLKSVSRAEIDMALNGLRPVLLLTAVETELKTVLALLKPIHPKRSVYKAHIGQETYYLGTFGAETVVVTMCGMGAIGRDSVILAAQQAITELRPAAIIMIGIAFGRSQNRQAIGDVLIASQVVSYEQQRVGNEGIVNRGPVAQTGPILLNRFRQALDWEFKSPEGNLARAHIGPVLSGEKLIANEEFRDRLFELYPQAIGGEMEGAGLYSVASRAQIEWILVKGICDWADNRKADNAQTLAAQSAASLVHHVLSDPTALEAARA